MTSRVPLLFLVAVVLTTLIAVALEGPAAYIATGIMLAVLIIVGLPLALLTPGEQRVPEHSVLATFGHRRHF